MVLTLCDHNPELLTVVAKFQILVFQGDAYFHSGHYKKAEVSLLFVENAICSSFILQSIYKKALQCKKMLMKSKGKSASHIVSSLVNGCLFAKC